MTANQQILDEAQPIIERLAKSRSANGKFAYYENQDVYQEVWCMCLEALGRYDPEKAPLENFLVSHVTNRLKNLKRDKYFRPGSDIPTSGLARTRMNLINALPLNSDDMVEQGVLLCSTSISVNPADYSLCDETLSYIEQQLPEDLLAPFYDLINNNDVRGSIVEEVRQKVAEILIERNGNEGG